jgi:hypothetical protein
LVFLDKLIHDARNTEHNNNIVVVVVVVHRKFYFGTNIIYECKYKYGGTGAGTCECGNEPSVSIKFGEFLD